MPFRQILHGIFYHAFAFTACLSIYRVKNFFKSIIFHGQTAENMINF